MTSPCERLDPEWVAYHFGTCAPELRLALEAHLVQCPACVRRFVALKREIELVEHAPAPSEQARARIRASVVQALAPPRRPLRGWERPFAMGVASAAVALAVLVMHTAAVSRGALPRSLRNPPSATDRTR